MKHISVGQFYISKQYVVRSGYTDSIYLANIDPEPRFSVSIFSSKFRSVPMFKRMTRSSIFVLDNCGYFRYLLQSKRNMFRIILRIVMHSIDYMDREIVPCILSAMNLKRVISANTRTHGVFVLSECVCVCSLICRHCAPHLKGPSHSGGHFSVRQLLCRSVFYLTCTSINSHYLHRYSNQQKFFFLSCFHAE